MPVNLPTILGRDVAGIVRIAGARVKKFAAGDRVMAFAMNTYAQLCVVKATALTRVPEGMEMTQATAIPLVAITGDGLMRDATKAQHGQTILLAGALGSVGRVAAFAASEIGAKVIAGVRQDKLEDARKLPGVIDAVALDDEASLAKLGQVDAVANTLMGDITAKLIRKIKQGGIFSSVADMPSNAAQYPTITANRIQANANARVIAHYAEAVNSGNLELPVERILELQDAPEAHQVGEKGGVGGKIVMTVAGATTV
ncbi:MAG: zinc-binding dehydrogenase [Acidobacteriales bacterium]|nr:zinc-binding dehydrogenase [Terriglobales bacterium]